MRVDTRQQLFTRIYSGWTVVLTGHSVHPWIQFNSLACKSILLQLNLYFTLKYSLLFFYFLTVFHHCVTRVTYIRFKFHLSPHLISLLFVTAQEWTRDLLQRTIFISFKKNRNFSHSYVFLKLFFSFTNFILPIFAPENLLLSCRVSLFVNWKNFRFQV